MVFRLNKSIFILSIIVVVLTAILLAFPCSFVMADIVSETIYSEVLDDLQKDSNFNKDNYPIKSQDYSLNIIQIAESADNELFVYVYQPSGQNKKLTASTINISTTINDEIKFRNYKLKLLNSNGVFFKYMVSDFVVSTVPTRYYAVSSIYRPFDGTIDNQADHDNTITEVNYDVSKQYCFSVINGNPYCQVVDIETITITDKFVGFVRYFDGYHLFGSGSCDSHFVAFNTDRRIDKLLEADVYYTTQKWIAESIAIAPYIDPTYTYYEKKECYADLVYTQKVEHTGSGWGAGTYKWDRIETVEQFIEENTNYRNVYSGAIFNVNVGSSITEEGKKALEGKKWVLRFAETSYGDVSLSETSRTRNGTMVGDVTILRLKFETDGIVYNLGTIDNKQSGSDKPINVETIKASLSGLGSSLLGIILVIVLIIVLLPLLSKLFASIGKSIKNLSKRE